MRTKRSANAVLTTLCPEWQTKHVLLYMVLPDRRQLTPALRLLREFVAQACAALPGAGGLKSNRPLAPVS